MIHISRWNSKFCVMYFTLLYTCGCLSHTLLAYRYLHVDLTRELTILSINHQKESYLKYLKRTCLAQLELREQLEKRNLRIKPGNQSCVQFWGHARIHTQETGCQSGVQSCIMARLNTYLVQNFKCRHCTLIFWSSTVVFLNAMLMILHCVWFYCNCSRV